MTNTIVPPSTIFSAFIDDLYVTVELINIAPDIAAEMLTHNTHNRNMRRDAHRRYVRDMQAGNWSFTGAPITFDANGVLLDGQNRLTAIIDSGRTIPTIVIRGLRPEAQDDTDTGITRKFSDLLTLRGEANANQLASVVRRVTEWNAGLIGKGPKFSNSELFATLNAHPELRERLARHQHLSRTVRPIAPTTAGLAWWVLSRIDYDDAEFFFDRLIDGQGLVEKDPIYELRATMARADRNVRGAANQTWVLAIIFKAWNAYRAGEKVGLFKWTPGGSRPEPFPDPM